MNITLKPLDAEHLEWARELHNDPDVLEMLTDPHIVTAEEQIEWFAKLRNSKSSQRQLVMVNNVPAGVVRLDQIDYFNKSICIGLDIHRDFRGQGLARKVYQMVCKEWFVTNEFNRIWLMVADYNKRARHIYEALGFQYEGVQRQALNRFGAYHDSHMMAILHQDWSTDD